MTATTSPARLVSSDTAGDGVDIGACTVVLGPHNVALSTLGHPGPTLTPLFLGIFEQGQGRNAAPTSSRGELLPRQDHLYAGTPLQRVLLPRHCPRHDAAALNRLDMSRWDRRLMREVFGDGFRGQEGESPSRA